MFSGQAGDTTGSSKQILPFLLFCPKERAKEKGIAHRREGSREERLLPPAGDNKRFACGLRLAPLDFGDLTPLKSFTQEQKLDPS